MRTEVTTYFLEMHDAPTVPLASAPAGVVVRENCQLPAHDYRALYQQVGGPWLWYERNALSDERLSTLLQREGVALHLLELEGQRVGYVETQHVVRSGGGSETQILYFGLVPQAIGRGVGRYFLNWSVHRAFRDPIDRLWVHTCSLDHPRALQTYESVGFAEFRRESGWVRIPDEALVLQRKAREQFGLT